jgi:methyl-accepting chemotaxis protein
MMRSTLLANSNLATVYTVWKPNAIDGMDSRFIGRPGSTSTGQYASAFDRGNNGQVVQRTSSDVDGAMAHFTSEKARSDRVTHPQPFTVNGRDTYVVRLFASILNRETNEVVGGVGCFIDISIIQPIVEGTMASYEECALMGIYSGNGFIMASFRPDRVGKMLIDADLHYGDFRVAANQAVLTGQEFSCTSYAPTLQKNVETTMIPFKVGTSDTTWTVMIGTTEDYILRKVKEVQSFTFLLAGISVIAAAVIVYFVLDFMIRPIVKVADTLMDISEGEGDLTRTITVKSKDEIGDLAKYFNKTLEKIKNLVKAIKKQTVELSDQSTTLASSMTETAAAINEITATIQNLKNRVINQSASVIETNATMDQVTQNINHLNELVENQTNNVSQSSASIEEMVATIRSVTETLNTNAANIRTLSDSSETGRTGLQDVAHDIKEIARESEGLLKLTRLCKILPARPICFR